MDASASRLNDRINVDINKSEGNRIMARSRQDFSSSNTCLKKNSCDKKLEKIKRKKTPLTKYWNRKSLRTTIATRCSQWQWPWRMRKSINHKLLWNFPIWMYHLENFSLPSTLCTSSRWAWASPVRAMKNHIDFHLTFTRHSHRRNTHWLCGKKTSSREEKNKTIRDEE